MENNYDAPAARIILANEPRLLRKLLVAALHDWVGDRVSEIDDGARLTAMLAQHQTTWLVLTLEPDAAPVDLPTLPAVNVIGLDRAGDNALIKWANGVEEKRAQVCLADLLSIFESPAVPALPY